ncbi:MAG: hypothetical protein ACLQJL_16130 [Roseiarcus sp.]
MQIADISVSLYRLYIKGLRRRRISRRQIFPKLFPAISWNINTLSLKKFGNRFFWNLLPEFGSASSPLIGVAGLAPAIHAATLYNTSRSRGDPAAWMTASSAGMTARGSQGRSIPGVPVFGKDLSLIFEEGEAGGGGGWTSGGRKRSRV